MYGIYEDIHMKQSGVTHLPCFPYLFSIQVNWVPGSDSWHDKHCVVPFSVLQMSRGSECLTIHNVTECCPLQPKYLLHSVLKRMAHCRVQHQQFIAQACTIIPLFQAGCTVCFNIYSLKIKHHSENLKRPQNAAHCDI